MSDYQNTTCVKFWFMQLFRQVSRFFFSLLYGFLSWKFQDVSQLFWSNACLLVVVFSIITKVIRVIKQHHLRTTNTGETRIVRGSDYSPASELFARVRQTMTGNNPKLDLVNIDAHKKMGQILTICSQGIKQKQNSDINQGPKLSKVCKK